MHLIVNTDGSVVALAGRDLMAGPDQVLVTLLDPETARAEHALAAIAPARDAFLAAVQARGQATSLNDLAGLDKALTTALAALTAAQIDAAQAGAALATAEQGVRDAFNQADTDAAKQFGAQGQVWWDGTSFRVRERPVDPAETALLAEAQELATRATANPDLALAIRAMFGVDPTNLDAMVGAMKARRLG